MKCRNCINDAINPVTGMCNRCMAAALETLTAVQTAARVAARFRPAPETITVCCCHTNQHGAAA